MAKRKIKVLHVLKSSIYSGAENVVITIMKNLKKDYEFMYLATDGTIRETLEQEQIPFVLLSTFNIKNLLKVIREYQPDIIHAHDFSATVLCALVPGRFRLISHLHYDPPWVRKWNVRTCIYLAISVRISKVLTVSEKSYQRMIFAKYYRNKHLTVGNPVDAVRIRTMSKEVIYHEKYDLIFVGRFVEQKDPQQFINIVKLLRDKRILVKSAMLGCGELETECRKLIQTYKLENQIDLLGFRSNPYPFIKDAKILCMTSKWEGYGLVLIEANILGVPVLSSRTSGSEEVLGEFACELCDREEDFTEKICVLLENPDEYKQWKRLAEKRVSEHIIGKDYMNSMSAIYQTEL